jgi:ABC-2 type transport system permease protein
MNRPYSQFKAMMAVLKSSFKAQMKSPSALVFGFAFPLFFILIFGSPRTGTPTISIGFTPDSDTSFSNSYFQGLKMIPMIKVIRKDSAELYDDLVKGRMTAILNLRRSFDTTKSAYDVDVISSKASQQNIQLLASILNSLSSGIEKAKPGQSAYTFATINQPKPIGDRIYNRIDFVLPGQLGFSLLSAGLFGVSFLFFNLRETLVLKRMNATPIRRPFIILGEALARILFQLIIIALIILAGKYLFNFVLVKGFQTFMELIFLSIIGLLVFMGFGFVISSIAKSINTIPVYTNLLGFPQFMLSGTFFPYEGLPQFLHPLCRSLPLTHLNNALRKVSFEGLPLSSCMTEIGVMAVWTLVLYAIAFKMFKWE